MRGFADVALMLVWVIAACGRDHGAAAEATPVERAIDEELARRFGVAVVTRCPPYVPTCTAKLPDGSTLPILLDHGEWKVLGMVVVSDVLEEYVRAELADLGAVQGVRCAPRVRRVAPNERIECWLAHGGKAFITVHADGSTAVEIALDAAAAAARSEPESPELVNASHALEHVEDGDGEDDDDHPR